MEFKRRPVAARSGRIVALLHYVIAHFRTCESHPGPFHVCHRRILGAGVSIVETPRAHYLAHPEYIHSLPNLQRVTVHGR